VKLDMFLTLAMEIGHVVCLEGWARLEILKTLATLITHVLMVERVIITMACRVLSAVELKIHAMPSRHVMELGKYDMFAHIMCLRTTGNVLHDTLKEQASEPS
jgi:hypothetical protein